MKKKVLISLFGILSAALFTFAAVTLPTIKYADGTTTGTLKQWYDAVSASGYEWSNGDLAVMIGAAKEMQTLKASGATDDELGAAWDGSADATTFNAALAKITYGGALYKAANAAYTPQLKGESDFAVFIDWYKNITTHTDDIQPADFAIVEKWEELVRGCMTSDGATANLLNEAIKKADTGNIIDNYYATISKGVSFKDVWSSAAKEWAKGSIYKTAEEWDTWYATSVVKFAIENTAVLNWNGIFSEMTYAKYEGVRAAANVWDPTDEAKKNVVTNPAEVLKAIDDNEALDAAAKVAAKKAYTDKFDNFKGTKYFSNETDYYNEIKTRLTNRKAAAISLFKDDYNTVSGKVEENCGMVTDEATACKPLFDNLNVWKDVADDFNQIDTDFPGKTYKVAKMIKKAQLCLDYAYAWNFRRYEATLPATIADADRTTALTTLDSHLNLISSYNRYSQNGNADFQAFLNPTVASFDAKIKTANQNYYKGQFDIVWSAVTDVLNARKTAGGDETTGYKLLAAAKTDALYTAIEALLPYWNSSTTVVDGVEITVDPYLDSSSKLALSATYDRAKIEKACEEYEYMTTAIEFLTGETWAAFTSETYKKDETDPSKDKTAAQQFKWLVENIGSKIGVSGSLGEKVLKYTREFTKTYGDAYAAAFEAAVSADIAKLGTDLAKVFVDKCTAKDHELLVISGGIATGIATGADKAGKLDDWTAVANIYRNLKVEANNQAGVKALNNNADIKLAEEIWTVAQADATLMGTLYSDVAKEILKNIDSSIETKLGEIGLAANIDKLVTDAVAEAAADELVKTYTNHAAYEDYSAEYLDAIVGAEAKESPATPDTGSKAALAKVQGIGKAGNAYLDASKKKWNAAATTWTAATWTITTADAGNLTTLNSVLLANADYDALVKKIDDIDKAADWLKKYVNSYTIPESYYPLSRGDLDNSYNLRGAYGEFIVLSAYAKQLVSKFAAIMENNYALATSDLLLMDQKYYIVKLNSDGALETTEKTTGAESKIISTDIMKDLPKGQNAYVYTDVVKTGCTLPANFIAVEKYEKTPAVGDVPAVYGYRYFATELDYTDGKEFKYLAAKNIGVGDVDGSIRVEKVNFTKKFYDNDAHSFYTPFTLTKANVAEMENCTFYYMNSATETPVNKTTSKLSVNWLKKDAEYVEKNEDVMIYGYMPYIVKSAAEIADVTNLEFTLTDVTIGAKPAQDGSVDCNTTTATITLKGEHKSGKIEDDGAGKNYTTKTYTLADQNKWVLLFDYNVTAGKPTETKPASKPVEPVLAENPTPAQEASYATEKEAYDAAIALWNAWEAWETAEATRKSYGKLNAGSAYMYVEGRSGVNYIMSNDIEEDGEANAIESIEIANKSVKGIFTVGGQKVNDMAAPGLYIVDGKKVLVK